MSVTATFSFLALTRSTFAYNCGTLARKVEKRRREPRILARRGHQRGGGRLELLRRGAARPVLHLHLESARLPDPSHGRRLEHQAKGLLDSGELTHQVTGDGRGGLGRLARSLAEML